MKKTMKKTKFGRTVLLAFVMIVTCSALVACTPSKKKEANNKQTQSSVIQDKKQKKTDKDKKPQKGEINKEKAPEQGETNKDEVSE